MVFGKPIVMYYTHEGKVTAGEAAVYVEKDDPVEFAEKLLDLLSDKGTRQWMGRIAKERIVHDLNWEQQKAVLYKAYRHLDNNC